MPMLQEMREALKRDSVPLMQAIIDKYVSQICKVRRLEVQTIKTRPELMHDGNSSYRSLACYGFLLGVFLKIHEKTLTQRHKDELKRTMDNFFDLAEDRYRLYDAVESGQDYYERKSKILDEKNEVYLLCGYSSGQGKSGHLAIARIARLGTAAGYVITFFNAGHGVEMTREGVAKVSVTYNLKPGVINSTDNIFKAVYNLRHADQWSYVSILEELKSNFTNNEIYFRPSRAQHKGNCTTRSPREVIFDVFGDEIGEVIQNFVAYDDHKAIGNISGIQDLLAKHGENYTLDDLNNACLFKNPAAVVACMRYFDSDITSQMPLFSESNFRDIQYFIGEISQRKHGRALGEIGKAFVQHLEAGTNSFFAYSVLMHMDLDAVKSLLNDGNMASKDGRKINLDIDDILSKLEALKNVKRELSGLDLSDRDWNLAVQNMGNIFEFDKTQNTSDQHYMHRRKYLERMTGVATDDRAIAVNRTLYNGFVHPILFQRDLKKYYAKLSPQGTSDKKLLDERWQNLKRECNIEFTTDVIEDRYRKVFENYNINCLQDDREYANGVIRDINNTREIDWKNFDVVTVTNYLNDFELTLTPGGYRHIYEGMYQIVLAPDFEGAGDDIKKQAQLELFCYAVRYGDVAEWTTDDDWVRLAHCAQKLFGHIKPVHSVLEFINGKSRESYLSQLSPTQLLYEVSLMGRDDKLRDKARVLLVQKVIKELSDGRNSLVKPEEYVKILNYCTLNKCNFSLSKTDLDNISENLDLYDRSVSKQTHDLFMLYLEYVVVNDKRDEVICDTQEGAKRLVNVLRDLPDDHALRILNGFATSKLKTLLTSENIMGLIDRNIQVPLLAIENSNINYEQLMDIFERRIPDLSKPYILDRVHALTEKLLVDKHKDAIDVVRKIRTQTEVDWDDVDAIAVMDYIKDLRHHTLSLEGYRHTYKGMAQIVLSPDFDDSGDYRRKQAQLELLCYAVKNGDCAEEITRGDWLKISRSAQILFGHIIPGHPLLDFVNTKCNESYLSELAQLPGGALGLFYEIKHMDRDDKMLDRARVLLAQKIANDLSDGDKALVQPEEYLKMLNYCASNKCTFSLTQTDLGNISKNLAKHDGGKQMHDLFMLYLEEINRRPPPAVDQLGMREKVVELTVKQLFSEQSVERLTQAPPAAMPRGLADSGNSNWLGL